MLFLKMLMLINVFCICTILGFSFGNRYSKRLNGLYDLQELARLLHTELIVFLTPIPIALDNISERTSENMSEILTFMIKKIEEDEIGDLFTIFNEASYLLKEKFSLEQDDIDVFMSLGKVIGKSNRENQELQIGYVLNSLQELIQEAKEEKTRYEKMYGSLGIILGLGIVIILV